MKWFLIVGIALAALVVIILLVGTCLPRKHVATRATIIHKPADALFATIRDFAAQPSWRTGISSVELLPPRDGQISFRETSRHGAITFVVQEEKPAAKLVTEIADDALPFGGTWTIELTSTNDATTVRITEHGEVKNPAFRFMARFVFGYTATMESYLRDLARKFGEEYTPQS